jgi:hypothetical protein
MTTQKQIFISQRVHAWNTENLVKHGRKGFGRQDEQQKHKQESWGSAAEIPLGDSHLVYNAEYVLQFQIRRPGAKE